MNPSSFSLAILYALQEKPIYRGTVSAVEVLARRKRNKAARKARRKNRK